MNEIDKYINLQSQNRSSSFFEGNMLCIGNCISNAWNQQWFQYIDFIETSERIETPNILKLLIRQRQNLINSSK